MVYRAIIFKTLLYFDLFNFPPNKEELWQFLQAKIDHKSFEKTLKGFSKHKSYYFISNKKFVIQRIAREKINKVKIKKIFQVSQNLKQIPTVKFVGISGSLSMKNAQENDDIDIFIITESQLVWLTRLICILILSLLGSYRRKNDKNVKDKICLNFLIDKDNLKFQKNRQNLYTAHEIVQLLPIFDKDEIYACFINKNEWVNKFLPNFKDRLNHYQILSYKTSISDKLLISLFKILRLENLARIIQLSYMKHDITIETIKAGYLAFHPINYEKETLNKLNLRTRNKHSQDP